MMRTYSSGRVPCAMCPTTGRNDAPPPSPSEGHGVGTVRACGWVAPRCHEGGEQVWRLTAVTARILAMETTSLADAKNRLSELVSAVQGTWERVTITKNGRPAAVLIAPEDLESLIETLEILSDPDAMAAIREARTGAGELTTGEEMAALMAQRLGRGAA